jgi:hypothetical protein
VAACAPDHPVLLASFAFSFTLLMNDTPSGALLRTQQQYAKNSIVRREEGGLVYYLSDTRPFSNKFLFPNRNAKWFPDEVNEIIRTGRYYLWSPLFKALNNNNKQFLVINFIVPLRRQQYF